MITHSDEIERLASINLHKGLQDFFIKSDLKLRFYPYTQEKGVDFQFEIESREDTPKTLGTFLLQNKGTINALKPLSTNENKGKISYKFDKIRNIIYFSSELQEPLIITICDLKTDTIYWLAIQLEAEEYLHRVSEISSKHRISRKGESIQIYLDPEKTIVKNGRTCLEKFEDFASDIEVENAFDLSLYAN